MPEISVDATVLIATSWQALGRAETGDQRTMIANCTVIIVFAGFFIEANLNHIIDAMENEAELVKFAGTDRPGLGAKFAWYYRNFISEEDISEKSEVYAAAHAEFPELREITDFRNGVSHGRIDRDAATLDNAKRLRIAAKRIIDRLLEAAAEAGHEIQRGVTYNVAIASSDLPLEDNGLAT